VSSIFQPTDADYCTADTLCRPYRYYDYCAENASFLDFVSARRDLYSDPAGREKMLGDDLWYHLLDDKMAAKAFMDDAGIQTPRVYLCSDNLDDILTFSTVANGFVVKAGDLHSSRGVFVLPDGFGGAELLNGIKMSAEDVKGALEVLGAKKFIIEQFIPGTGGSLPDEMKIHMFNGEVGSIIYTTNRGSNCECFAELDDSWQRLDTNGCFRSSGEAATDGVCTKIDTASGTVQSMKGQDLCGNTPAQPANLDAILTMAADISTKIGVYMRIDLLIASDGSYFVGEFTPGHTNGRVHCASKLDPETGCVDSCFLGKMWTKSVSDVGGDQLHGGSKKPVPTSLVDWNDTTSWDQACGNLMTALAARG